MMTSHNIFIIFILLTSHQRFKHHNCVHNHDLKNKKYNQYLHEIFLTKETNTQDIDYKKNKLETK